MPYKILFISHDNDLFGAERCLIDLVTGLDRSRIEPIVLLPFPGPITEILKDADISFLIRYIHRWIPTRKNASYKHLFNYIKNWRSNQWSILHLIEQENIDLIYSNTTTVLEGAIAAQRADIPHIWHIHEYLRGNQDIFSYLPFVMVDRLIDRLSDRIITPSQALARQRFSNSSNKTQIIPNGIDVNSFQPGDANQLRISLAIPPKAPIISFIGGLNKRKDPITFIRAAAIISKVRPDTHFLIVGEQSDSEIVSKIYSLIKEFDLVESCHLLGYRRDIANILSASTVHTSTSIQETFGLTLIEAMALGKPIVATHCGGPEEVIINGETGFLLPPCDSNAIAEKILYLINHPDFAVKMGQTANKRVKQCFSMESYISSIENVILETLEKKNND